MSLNGDRARAEIVSYIETYVNFGTLQDVEFPDICWLGNIVQRIHIYIDLKRQFFVVDAEMIW